MSTVAPRTVFDRPFQGAAKRIPKRDAILLPYQAKWVTDNSRIKLCEKSRQIGWTWATAYRLISRKGLADARLDAWISSRDDIQAKLFIQDCKAFASLLDVGAQDMGEKVIDDKGHSASVLRMANGLTLNSMSSNPDAQAGKRGDRVLDEFALHPDPRKLYAIAYPGITWGGSLEIFSTHRGSQNFFNELIREIRERGNPKKISLHRVTLEDALNDDSDEDMEYALQEAADLGAEVGALAHEKKVLDLATAALIPEIANIDFGAGADIIDQLDAVAIQVLKGAGYGSAIELSFLLGPTFGRRLKNHASLKGRFGGSTKKDMMPADLDQLTGLFLLKPNIKISAMVIDSAPMGKDPSRDFIIDNQLIVFARKAAPTRRDPSFMKTFRKRGAWLAPRTYLRDDGRVEVAALDWSEDVQITNTKAGQLLGIAP